jgi:hypothetical protein
VETLKENTFVVTDIVDYLKEKFSDETKQGSGEDLIEDLTKVRTSEYSGRSFDTALSSFSYNEELINQCTERLLVNAEAIAVNRLAFAQKIETIVKDNSLLINIILYIAELLQIKVKETKYDTSTNEMIGYEFYVKQDSKLSFNQILTVAVETKNILKDMRNQINHYSNESKRLNSENEFKNGVLTSLRNRVKEFEDKEKIDTFKYADLAYIYSGERGRYLYAIETVVIKNSKKSKKSKKSIKYEFKSTKTLSEKCIYTNKKAHDILLEAVSNSDLKGVWNYSIVQLAITPPQKDTEVIAAAKSKRVL